MNISPIGNGTNFNGRVLNNSSYKKYLSLLPAEDIEQHKKLVEKISKINDGRVFDVYEGGEYDGSITRKYFGIFVDTEKSRKYLAVQDYLLKDKTAEVEDYSCLKTLFEKAFKVVYGNRNKKQINKPA